jgi:hypothetical protein
VNDTGKPEEKARRVRPVAALGAVRGRLHELGMSADDLAITADVSYANVKYFYWVVHGRETLDRMSVALGWEPDFLRQVMEGEIS